jgi:acyl-CoA synthetase (AMP-forming)/AMP-acid ligase II
MGAMGATYERLTAEQSDADQRRVAGALAARGVVAGDRVVYLTTSSAAMLSAVLGTLRAGVVAVPLNPGLLDHERAALIADADPALVVDDRVLAELLADDRPTELAPAPLARPMHYTSGTTGRPKGVWSGVLTEDEGLALQGEERELWHFAADDRHLVCSPMHHSAPIRFGGGTLAAGGEVVVLGRFDARRAIDAIGETRPTSAFMVPAHLHRLFEAVGADDDVPTASFRLLAHAGAPCPPPLKLRALEAFGSDTVWEFYGSTEGQFTACSGTEWQRRPGTVGRARPHRALAVDDDGTIWCAAPTYARWEYWRDAEATDRAWRDGAFTVGDLGTLDDDGYLWLDGRREDLIISGGVNVYPAEVEAALSSAPGVVEVAVFGIDDERWGSRVCAAVVGPARASDVVAFAREVLAAYKCPKDVYLVDDLPRTSTGKVRRLDLPAMVGQPPAGAKSE